MNSSGRGGIPKDKQGLTFVNPKTIVLYYDSPMESSVTDLNGSLKGIIFSENYKENSGLVANLPPW